MNGDSPRVQWISRVLMILLALGILVPSMWGFGTKLLEFVALARGEADGAFAVTPLANYLLASTGFLLLFAWAAANGMFHDIERPKRTMLENEEWLDRHYDAGRLRE